MKKDIKMKQIMHELEFNIPYDMHVYMKSMVENMISISNKGLFDGEVVYKDTKYAWVDINFKSLFKVNLTELDSNSLENNKVQVFIENTDPCMCNLASASRALDESNWEKIKIIFNNKETVSGIIESKVKGGYYVALKDLGVAFLPGSQVGFNKDLVDEEPLDIGHELEFMIININERNRNIIISRKELINCNVKNLNKEEMKTIQVGTILEGLIKNIMPYGSFVSLGYKDGLLHISDISWYKIQSPAEIISIGERIKVIVTQVSEDGKKFSLGIKQLTPDPMRLFTIGESVKVNNIEVIDNKVVCNIPCKENPSKMFDAIIQVDTNLIGDTTFIDKIKDLEFQIADIDTQNRIIKIFNPSLVQDTWDILENIANNNQVIDMFTISGKNFDTLSLQLTFNNLEYKLIYDEIDICNPQAFIQNCNIGDHISCYITSFNKSKKLFKLSRKSVLMNQEKEKILEFADQNINKQVPCIIDRIIPEGIYVLVGKDKYLSFINKYKLGAMSKSNIGDTIEPILLGFDDKSFKFNFNCKIGKLSKKSTDANEKAVKEKTQLHDHLDKDILEQLKKKLDTTVK